MTSPLMMSIWPAMDFLNKPWNSDKMVLTLYVRWEGTCHCPFRSYQLEDFKVEPLEYLAHDPVGFQLLPQILQDMPEVVAIVAADQDREQFINLMIYETGVPNPDSVNKGFWTSDPEGCHAVGVFARCLHGHIQVPCPNTLFCCCSIESSSQGTGRLSWEKPCALLVFVRVNAKDD